MRYRITHHYLTIGDNGEPIVEHETEDADETDTEAVADAVAIMLAHPGGRSGTTITLVVAALDAVTV